MSKSPWGKTNNTTTGADTTPNNTSVAGAVDIGAILSQNAPPAATSGHARNSSWIKAASKGSHPVATTTAPAEPSSSAPAYSASKSALAAATSSVAPNVLFDYFVVLDFEATCQKDSRIDKQEIIEFPFVIVDGATLKIVAEFQRYVKPVFNPTLSEFCHELTGIEQAWVDKAKPFDVVFAEVQDFLRVGGLGGEASPKTFAFVTCGDWDLKTMLPTQLRHIRGTSPKYFYHWINLKIAMSKACGNKRIGGMEDMLRHYNLPLVGRHHSGIDDCRNIAAVLMQMLKTGVAVDITTTSQTAAKNSIPEVRRRAMGAPAQVSSFPPSSLDPDFPKAAVTGPQPSPVAAAASSSSATEKKGGVKVPDVVVDRTAVSDKDGRLLIDESRNPKQHIPAPTGAALDPKAQTTFSRRLTSALRHKALDMGLFMFKNGYVSLDELLANNQFRGLSVPVVSQIVKDCNKQRFGLVYGVDGKLYLCANQGHSITGVQSDFKVIKSSADAPVCVHGTNLKAWELIKESGLSPMGRLHIHFAKGTPGADGVISGMRSTADVLIYVDVDKMVNDGIPLWESANGVLLSSGDHQNQLISKAYFSKVLNRKTGASLL